MFFCQKRRKEQIIFQQKQVKRLLAQGENLLNPCNHVDKKTYVLMFFCQEKPVDKTLVLLSKISYCLTSDMFGFFGLNS